MSDLNRRLATARVVKADFQEKRILTLQEIDDLLKRPQYVVTYLIGKDRS